MERASCYITIVACLNSTFVPHIWLLQRRQVLVKFCVPQVSQLWVYAADSSFQESKSLQGINFPDVKIMHNVGLLSNIIDLLQCGGHVGQRDGSKGLSILFYDPWALTLPLDDYNNAYSDNPDWPHCSTKAATSKKDHPALPCVQLVQCKDCLRQFFATYLGDRAPKDMLSPIIWPFLFTDLCTAL